MQQQNSLRIAISQNVFVNLFLHCCHWTKSKLPSACLKMLTVHKRHDVREAEFKIDRTKTQDVCA